MDSAFTDFFLQKGKDWDHSYISFQGKMIDNDTLKIETTGWGIRETGLLLERRNSKNSAIFRMLGECGTISSTTWVKVNFKRSLPANDFDTLMQIGFTRTGDSLIVRRLLK